MPQNEPHHMRSAYPWAHRWSAARSSRVVPRGPRGPRRPSTAANASPVASAACTCARRAAPCRSAAPPRSPHSRDCSAVPRRRPRRSCGPSQRCGPLSPPPPTPPPPPPQRRCTSRPLPLHSRECVLEYSRLATADDAPPRHANPGARRESDRSEGRESHQPPLQQPMTSPQRIPTPPPGSLAPADTDANAAAATAQRATQRRRETYPRRDAPRAPSAGPPGCPPRPCRPWRAAASRAWAPSPAQRQTACVPPNSASRLKAVPAPCEPMPCGVSHAAAKLPLLKPQPLSGFRARQLSSLMDLNPHLRGNWMRRAP